MSEESDEIEQRKEGEWQCYGLEDEPHVSKLSRLVELLAGLKDEGRDKACCH